MCLLADVMSVKGPCTLKLGPVEISKKQMRKAGGRREEKLSSNFYKNSLGLWADHIWPLNQT